MSEHGRDNVLDCLFSGQDGKIVNVKFFRGDGDLIAAEDMRGLMYQAHQALGKAMSDVGRRGR